MKLDDFVFVRDDYFRRVSESSIAEHWGQDDRYLKDYVRDNFEIAYRQDKVKEDEQKSTVSGGLGR